jgi:hypothetical protein
MLPYLQEYCVEAAETHSYSQEKVLKVAKDIQAERDQRRAEKRRNCMNSVDPHV